jgi:Cys-rich repeat protein
MGQVRGTAWLVLASLATACGFDFDRFDPAASMDASGGSTSDVSAAGAVDGASNGMPDAPSGTRPDAARNASADATSDASSVDTDDATSDAAIIFDAPTDQSAEGGCTSNSQCPAKTPHCSTATSQCVPCQGDGDCSGTTPYCGVSDGGGGACVQCLQSSQCPTRKPTCTSGKCG